VDDEKMMAKPIDYIIYRDKSNAGLAVGMIFLDFEIPSLLW
jgi:hypothetical protein